MVALTATVVLVGLAMTMPALAQSTVTTFTTTMTTTITSTITSTIAGSSTSQIAGSSTSQSTSSQSTAIVKVSLSYSSGGPGNNISITASGLVADRNVSAMFGTTPLNMSKRCTTNSVGSLSDCFFVVPHDPSGSYKVTVSDGTNNKTVTFTILAITIPESTLLITMTAVGLSLVTQLVTKKVVNIDAERRMRAEVSAFNKEKREATLAKDKAKLEKLKKRELPMRQEQAKVSSARLKVTAITFVPLLLVYYLMASFLGGFSVVVAHSSIPIPYLVGGGGTMALFWWYMLSSFTCSTLLSKLLHTTP